MYIQSCPLILRISQRNSGKNIWFGLLKKYFQFFLNNYKSNHIFFASYFSFSPNLVVVLCKGVHFCTCKYLHMPKCACAWKEVSLIQTCHVGESFGWCIFIFAYFVHYSIGKSIHVIKSKESKTGSRDYLHRYRNDL